MMRTRQFNRRNRRRSTIVRLSVEGRHKDSTTAALTTKIDAMETAFLTGLSGDGVKAGLYEDDLTTETSHVIDAQGSIDGIRVLQILYNRSGGAEYASQRSFGITLEVEYRQDGIGGAIQDFRETVRTVGTGGLKRRGVELATGEPYFQTLANKSIQTIYQEGFAIGFGGFPAVVPGPIFPANELFDLREEEPLSPQSHIKGYFDWGWRWSYTMLRGGSTAVANNPTSAPIPNFY